MKKDEKFKDDDNKISSAKRYLYTFGVLAGLIVVVFLCLMIYKNNFSVESLLSLLLAFFSIFISVFFYFKASDTSNNFYVNSYSIMKDMSVTLGQIQERFGEKLNNLNDKISLISEEEKEKKKELLSAEKEKQAIIDGLFEKLKIDKEEKESIANKLQEKEAETEALKQDLSRLNFERQKLNNINNVSPSAFLNFDTNELRGQFNISDYKHFLEKNSLLADNELAEKFKSKRNIKTLIHNDNNKY